MGKFVIKATKDGIKFDLKATNGQVIATSEVYTTEIACRNGIASVVKNAPICEIEDQTEKGFKSLKCPKFEMYTDKRGELRFRLKASNGQTIAVGEGYKTKANCINGIESIKKNVIDAPIEKID